VISIKQQCPDNEEQEAFSTLFLLVICLLVLFLILANLSAKKISSTEGLT
jgi:hypothetical protein